MRRSRQQSSLAIVALLVLVGSFFAFVEFDSEAQGQLTLETAAVSTEQASLPTRLTPPTPASPRAVTNRMESAVEESESSREEVAAAADESVELTVHVRRMINGVPGAGVADASVICSGIGVKGRTEQPLGVTDSRGQLTTTLAEAGFYRFWVDDESFPVDVNPPGRFRTGGLKVPGITRVYEKVEAGVPFELTLWCLEKRTMSGKVLDPGGLPGGNARVEMMPKDPDLEALAYRTSTNDDGEFVFSRLFPIEYTLRLKTLSGRLTFGRNREKATFPTPVSIDLRNASHPFVELNCAPGPGHLTGRIVDEDGLPFPGISVIASYFEPQERSSNIVPRVLVYEPHEELSRAISGEDGRFEMGDLNVVSTNLLVASEEAIKGRGPERLVASIPDLVRVPPTSFKNNVADVGDIVVQRSRTYVVGGSIKLTSKELDGRSLSMDKIMLSARFADSDSDLGLDSDREWPAQLRFGERSKPYVQYSRRSGNFLVSCDTPRERVTIRVHRIGKKKLYKDFVFYPTTDGVEKDVKLLFP